MPKTYITAGTRLWTATIETVNGEREIASNVPDEAFADKLAKECERAYKRGRADEREIIERRVGILFSERRAADRERGGRE